MGMALAAVLLTACTATTDPNAHTVTWSATGMSDSRGVPDPVACTALISHPCPIMLYMREIEVTPALDRPGAGMVALVWSGGTGGADFNGRTAEDEPPIMETATGDADTLTLTDRGDDGGLRHMATLTRAGNGYEGDVAWSLFTVAGHTTWRLTID